jgi:hypothetical protein
LQPEKKKFAKAGNTILVFEKRGCTKGGPGKIKRFLCC